jgi:hypothetical protein
MASAGRKPADPSTGDKRGDAMIFTNLSSQCLAEHIALSVKQARVFNRIGLRVEARHSLLSARNAKRELARRSAAQ